MYRPINSESVTSSHSFMLKLADMSHIMRKPVFAIFANDKGADQPAHPCSLISAFVVRCLDSTIPMLAKSKISRL